MFHQLLFLCLAVKPRALEMWRQTTLFDRMWDTHFRRETISNKRYLFTSYHNSHRRYTRNYCPTRLVLNAPLNNLIKFIQVLLVNLNVQRKLDESMHTSFVIEQVFRNFLFKCTPSGIRQMGMYP